MTRSYQDNRASPLFLRSSAVKVCRSLLSQRNSHALVSALCSPAASPLSAQQPHRSRRPVRTPLRPMGDESPFRRLELPTPNTIRTGAGTPGPDYWQQRVDYVIRASLDTVAQPVTGEERITYPNRSPDTLRYLWLQLDQNLFNSASRGSGMFESGLAVRNPRSRGRPDPDQGGGSGRCRQQNGRPVAGKATTLKYLVNGTMMKVDLAPPAAPGGSQVLDIGWSFPFGPNSNRMGIELIDGSYVYEVAQWYPATRRVRRCAGLEHGAVPGPGRVLPGVRQLRREPDRAGQYAGRRHRHAAESRRGPDRGPAHSAGPRADQRLDGDHPGRGRDRRPGVPSGIAHRAR